MNLSTLLLRNLRHYLRPHLLVLLGVTVTAAVITGALAVGDSVRFSLQKLALQRLGGTLDALATGDRFVRDALSVIIGQTLDIRAAAVLQREATANTPDESAYAGRIDVYGVTADFRNIAGEEFPVLQNKEAAVNPTLANLLQLNPGDSIVIRLPDPLRLPGDALAGSARHVRTLSLQVKAIVSADAGGNFQLKNLPAEEPALFLSLPVLQKALNLPGLCNQILLTTGIGRAATTQEANHALQGVFTPQDAGLRVATLQDKEVTEFSSRSVLIPPQLTQAFLARHPQAGQISTYFAESIDSAERSTPYSFLTASQNCHLPSPQPGKIILTDWLARDLNIPQPGASVTVCVQALASDGRLHQRRKRFVVESIIPVDAAAGRSLMPDFPGFSDADSCRDWDPDLPVDLSRIRPQDEEYWAQYQGTPKGFLNLEDARALWGSSYGFLTALRLPLASTPTLGGALSAQDEPDFKPDPLSLGFSFRPVQAEALQAGRNGVDFGQLFLSLSFFLILAALLLSALFFAFSAESRAPEVATLRALGFSALRVNRLMLMEAGLVAGAGSLCGSLCGIVYCHLVIAILNTNWQGAIGQTHLWPHTSFVTLLYGVLATFVMSAAAFMITLRRGKSLYGAQRGLVSPASPRYSCACVVSGGVAFLFAGILLASSDLHTSSAALFFGAGSILLGGGLLLAYGVLRYLRAQKAPGSFYVLALRQAARRPGRSMSVLTALACGIFLVASVGINRKDPAAGAGLPSSGTGGYSLYVETTLPLPADLNSPAVRGRLGLDAPELSDAMFVPLRMLSGDDASCLNLNRVSRPPLVGVPPEVFRQRGAFRFLSGCGSAPPSWALLQQAPLPHKIPAVADQSVLTWGLGMSVGDDIPYPSESGAPLQVRLCGGLGNSIFQGSLLVPEQELVRYFPTGSAIRGLLVDTAHPQEAASTLRQALRDYGVMVQNTANRLEQFSRVEDTYLTIFLLLGGLGLVLGSAGLGVLLMRNAWEQRYELALLRAVGFSRLRLAQLLLTEHAVLLTAGGGLGLLASLASAVPAIAQAGGRIPLADLILVIGLLILNAVLWTTVAAWKALRQPLFSTLREE